VQDFEDGNRLGECEERVECIVEAIEMIVREENRDEEDGSESDSSPQYEAYTVVCEKVVLPGQERLGAAGIGVRWVLHCNDVGNWRVE
jgi:hypothetical protein